MFNDSKGNCIRLEESGRPFIPLILKREELNDVIAKEAFRGLTPFQKTTRHPDSLMNEHHARPFATFRHGTESFPPPLKLTASLAIEVHSSKPRIKKGN